MKVDAVKKVMILDESAGDKCHKAFYEMLTKARSVFTGDAVDFICVAPCKDKNNPIAEGDYSSIISAVEAAIIEEKPQVLLIPATPLGEEVAPALGIRLDTGVAAHFVDIAVNEDNRIAYMVPAFGGKVIGEIFVPGAGESRCAIATARPGTFEGSEDTAGSFRFADVSRPRDFEGFELVNKELVTAKAKDITKADVIMCGGFGIGGEEYWQKLQLLADRLGGAAACTRPVIDQGWGPDEHVMIGTSGTSVKPKVYVGFGISGAAHHLCGIQKASVIVNINSDKTADSLVASDYKAVADAKAVIDAMVDAVK